MVREVWMTGPFSGVLDLSTPHRLRKIARPWARRCIADTRTFFLRQLEVYFNLNVLEKVFGPSHKGYRGECVLI